MMDEKLVLTLDAGGTNFVYSAWLNAQETMDPITTPSFGGNLHKCIEGMIYRFESIIAQMDVKPAAISIAFPGPTDYNAGVIGDLQNLPGFRGGVPLAAILEAHFNVPVFIRNDGDLFALGEALHGYLPKVNTWLQSKLNTRVSSSLFGITLGSGIGGGLVIHNQLYAGVNFFASEIWQMKLLGPNGINLEKYCSKKGLGDLYSHYSGVKQDMSPAQIASIAEGKEPGNALAAKKVFEETGKVLGHALHNLIAVLDCHIVFGGAISGAYHLFAPAMFQFLKESIPQQVIDWEQVESMENLTSSIGSRPFIIVGKSVMETSRAIHAGAYSVAIKHLNFQC